MNGLRTRLRPLDALAPSDIAAWESLACDAPAGIPALLPGMVQAAARWLTPPQLKKPGLDRPGFSSPSGAPGSTARLRDDVFDQAASAVGIGFLALSDLASSSTAASLSILLAAATSRAMRSRADS